MKKPTYTKQNEGSHERILRVGLQFGGIISKVSSFLKYICICAYECTCARIYLYACMHIYFSPPFPGSVSCKSQEADNLVAVST